MQHDWEQRTKSLLKAELKKRDLTYSQLCDKLAVINVIETPENIANKISRGRFSAVFLMQCLDVIGCTELQLKL